MFTKLVKDSLAKHHVPQQFFIRQCSYSSKMWNNINERRNLDLKFHLSCSCVTREDVQQLNEVFPTIVTSLVDTIKHTNISVINNWYRKLLEYTVPNGKHRRAFSTILTYKLLEDPQKLTPENIRLANILGWCTEMLNASLLMSDDMLDETELRRGEPCWHQLEDVKMSAVNDVSVLENSAYTILRKYLRQHPSYMSLMELCHDMTLKTGIGQALDYRTGLSGNGTIESFSMDRYRAIVLYKAGYFIFQFPVAAGMYLAGIQDAELHKDVEFVLQEFGYWSHVKNDMLDCFGDSDTHTATLYNDIREGKCTWAAVMTLQRATSAQRTVMEECYGRPDNESVQAVVDIYKDLDMPKIYENHKAEIFQKIHTNIEQINPRIPKKVFYNIMEML